tara:strand:- start:42982 stop:43767 length:786 start_codon:yes stop_codon:yes gene_type:complete
MTRAKLYLGDCLEVMKEIEKESIDLVLTDPPYGTTACAWDTIIPFDEMWEVVHRVSKKDSVIALFGSEPFSSLLRCSNLKKFKYDWIWSKSNPSNIALAKKHPMKYHEIISIFIYGKNTYFPQMIKRESQRVKQAIDSDYIFENKGSEQTLLKNKKYNAKKYNAKKKFPSSILQFNSLRPNSGEFFNHPTQKPVELLKYLIRTYTKTGETVLDFTMGSGSTGVAALKTYRKFIGIEKDPKYFDLAAQRMRAAFGDKVEIIR